MKINNKHLQIFRQIKKRFIKKTKIHRSGYWKTFSGNDIWLDMICQVIVVGGSAPADKFFSDAKLLRQVGYGNLCRIERKKDIASSINQALRAVGTRYASKKISECKKTSALLHNFLVLKKSKGGPKGLLSRINKLGGRNQDIRRIKYFMKVLEYMQSKSARDFLMGKGLVVNAVAIDIRIQSIFKAIGIKLPDGFATNPSMYDTIEKELLNQICIPLGLTGVQFDRMLYQNYDEIIQFVRKHKN